MSTGAAFLVLEELDTAAAFGEKGHTQVAHCLSSHHHNISNSDRQGSVFLALKKTQDQSYPG